MKKYICRFPGCSTLIEKPGHCDKHAPLQKMGRKPFEGAVRSNESLYRGYKWKQLQKRIVARDGRCNYCGVSKSESQLQAHHTVPPRGNEDLFFDEQNLVTVCPECHAVLTQMEINNRRRTK